MKPHPLALRRFAALGLGSSAALLTGSAIVASNVSCCPPPENTGPYTATVARPCLEAALAA